jgi:hypothetical protein
METARQTYLYSGDLLNQLKKFAINPSGEGFQDGGSGGSGFLGFFSRGAGLVYSLFILLLLAIPAFGAARLSYCYNMFIGNSTTMAVIYSILCFFFPGIYYPVYALFLNPVCAMQRPVMNNMTGGRRR